MGKVDTPTCFVKGYSLSMEKKVPIDQWTQFSGQSVSRLEGGLINGTWRVGDPPVGVLQSLSSIFSPEVNRDIQAVTEALGRKGLETPTLLQTKTGKLWHVDEKDRCWRALSWIPGRTYHRIPTPQVAHQAGLMVGRWHRALEDFSHTFHFSRPGAHDTSAHMAFLNETLSLHPDHAFLSEVNELAEALFRCWEAWDGRLNGPRILAHGDLKISNLRFDFEERAIALLDLDTMGYLSRDVEMGDAWRSWCNPAAEDVVESQFDLALFEASARGYLEQCELNSEEREALPAGVERICLELAARFAADALNESYFGWNPDVAQTRGEHNLIRARGQLSLAQSVIAQRRDLERILKSA